MPIPKEVLDTVSWYESQGETPEAILGRLSQSGKYPDISQTIDYYSGQGISHSDIMQKLKGATMPSTPIAQAIQQPQQPQPTIAQAAQEMQTPSDRSMIESLAGAARKTGEFLGLEKAVEPFARGAARFASGIEGVPKAAIEEALPKPTKGEYAGGFAQIASLGLPYGTIARGVGGVATRALPKVAQRIAPAIGTAAAGATGGYAVEAGRELQEGRGIGEVLKPGIETAVGAVAPVAIPAVAKKLLPKSKDAILRQTVKGNISKAIKPSQSSLGKTAKQEEKYYDKAKEAISSIVESKGKLEFIDETGNAVKGQLPKSVEDFRQSIDQVKKDVFEKYSNLAQQVGDAGIKIDATPIIKELEPIVDKAGLSLSHKQAAEFAKESINLLKRKGSYTPLEAQEVVTTINNSLKSFFKNPSFSDGTRIQVESIIKNNLNEMLDDAISNLTGAQYKQLKSNYGALKAIESDVNRRANSLANQATQSLVDKLTNISSGAAAVHGLWTFTPETLAAAGATKGLNALLKRRANPDRRIMNMFNRADAIITEETGRKIRGGLVEGVKGVEKPRLSFGNTPIPRFPGDIVAEKIRRR